MADFTAAIERIVAGLEKRNRLLNPLERRIVADHELGHAHGSAGAARAPIRCTRSRSSRAASARSATRSSDRPRIAYLMTRAELETRWPGCSAAAQPSRSCFGEISTGAADDLASVTDIARTMVGAFGMMASLGHVSYDRDRSPFLQPNFPMPQERNYSETTAEAVDSAVRVLVDSAFLQAFAILRQNCALLDRTAAALLETETLNEPEIESMEREIVAVPALPAWQ